MDASRLHYEAADTNPHGLLGAPRRTTTQIKPTTVIKAFVLSDLAAYLPPR
ncbi:MAG: hypothetical protein H6972_14480 [Gammaproteobacteria bacterium]|nr:hypothetical protein [Gammaproteobacteria bacterium]